MSLRIVLRPKVIDQIRPLVNKGQYVQRSSTRSYHRPRSLVPYIMQEMMRDLERPLFDQHFGLGVRPSRLFEEQFSLSPLFSGYLRPRRLRDLEDSGVSSIVNNKDCFKVSLDVQQFEPEELSVKVVDNCVVVEGKHEERSDEHGLVSRQFTRRYQLPEDVDVESLQSSLTADGVLQLIAVKRTETEKEVRSIPITRSDAPSKERHTKEQEQAEPNSKS